jgi:putative endonuclease
MQRDYNFWVYIVTNEHDNVLYIGITNDLPRRISEHRTGEIPGFTSDYCCKKLIYYEHCSDVRDAIAREKQLKKWSRAKKVALIATLNPRWGDLAPHILGE